MNIQKYFSHWLVDLYGSFPHKNEEKVRVIYKLKYYII